MRNSAQILVAILGLMLIIFIGYGIMVQTRKGISISDFFLKQEISLEDLQPVMMRNNDDIKPEQKEEGAVNNQVSDGNNYEKDGCYYIIVGSYKESVAAQEKAEKLRKSLNREFILLPQSKEGYFRISYGKYSTHEEAEAIIDGIRQNIDHGAWIYSTKN